MSYQVRPSVDPSERTYAALELNQPYGSFENIEENDDEDDDDDDVGTLQSLLPARVARLGGSGNSMIGGRASSGDGGWWEYLCGDATWRSLLKWNWLSILNLILIIVLVVNFWQHTKYDERRVAQLEGEIAGLRQSSKSQYNSLYLELSKLKSAEQEYEKHAGEVIHEVAENVTYVASTVLYHNKQLERLLNGTSNAEVLDKLRYIQSDVAQRLQEERDHIQYEIESSTRNVSEKLAQSGRELAATQRRVDRHLNETVLHMEHAVQVATAAIDEVQSNVTTRMDYMTVHVEGIVEELSSEVTAAQDTIQQEVHKVQDNIKQYVAVTNKQFAAENDFVRYQLAGTFTLLGCLISLWHVTSHLRHYYRPEVQRRIMAVLWMVPIYSITSWLSLVVPKMEPFLGAVRDCYEAYVIYTFIALLIAILEDGKGLVETVNKLTHQVVSERNLVTEYDRQQELRLEQQRQRNANRTWWDIFWNPDADSEHAHGGRSRVTAAGVNSTCNEEEEDDEDAILGGFASEGGANQYPTSMVTTGAVTGAAAGGAGSSSMAATPMTPATAPSQPSSHSKAQQSPHQPPHQQQQQQPYHTTRPVEHIRPPCPCCYRNHRPSSVAVAWLYQCQLMAMQFVMLKPLLTIVPLLLKATGVYNVDSVPLWVSGHGVNFAAPNLYIMLAQNFAVAVAFYGLLCFYHGTERDLEWCDPWPKFLCVKGVVFCTFWQSFGIQILSTMGRVDDRTASQIQNLLICIEMLLASLAHFYIFPWEEWEEGYKRSKEKAIALKDTLALRDFVKDMQMMVTSWETAGEPGVSAGGVGGGMTTPPGLISQQDQEKLKADLQDILASTGRHLELAEPPSTSSSAAAVVVHEGSNSNRSYNNNNNNNNNNNGNSCNDNDNFHNNFEEEEEDDQGSDLERGLSGSSRSNTTDGGAASGSSAGSGGGRGVGFEDVGLVALDHLTAGNSNPARRRVSSSSMNSTSSSTISPKRNTLAPPPPPPSTLSAFDEMDLSPEPLLSPGGSGRSGGSGGGSSRRRDSSGVAHAQQRPQWHPQGQGATSNDDIGPANKTRVGRAESLESIVSFDTSINSHQSQHDDDDADDVDDEDDDDYDDSGHRRGGDGIAYNNNNQGNLDSSSHIELEQVYPEVSPIALAMDNLPDTQLPQMALDAAKDSNDDDGGEAHSLIVSPSPTQNVNPATATKSINPFNEEDLLLENAPTPSVAPAPASITAPTAATAATDPSHTCAESAAVGRDDGSGSSSSSDGAGDMGSLMAHDILINVCDVSSVESESDAPVDRHLGAPFEEEEEEEEGGGGGGGGGGNQLEESPAGEGGGGSAGRHNPTGTEVRQMTPPTAAAVVAAGGSVTSSNTGTHRTPDSSHYQSIDGHEGEDGEEDEEEEGVVAGLVQSVGSRDDSVESVYSI